MIDNPIIELCLLELITIAWTRSNNPQLHQIFALAGAQLTLSQYRRGTLSFM